MSLATVQLWLARAGDLPLDAVDWRNRPSVPHRPPRTADAMEALVLAVRRSLREESDLGEYGAETIRRELAARDDLPGPLPAVRTIGRILARHGALDARRRRHPTPPPGWYLPDVRDRLVELDSFDVIEGMLLRGEVPLDVLTGISLHGGLRSAWPSSVLRSGHVVARLRARWREVGRPGYAQFDNDARFIGGASVPDSIGFVIRFCLAAEVTPVFAPARETGFQAAIESFNGLWQRKVWARLANPSLEQLQEASARYIAASRARHAIRIEAAPPRRPLPVTEQLNLRRPHGRIVFIRRATDTGAAFILNRRHVIDPAWAHRLVRAELDIDAGRIDVFGLRRAAPTEQPLLATLAYDPPARWFR